MADAQSPNCRNNKAPAANTKISFFPIRLFSLYDDSTRQSRNWIFNGFKTPTFTLYRRDSAPARNSAHTDTRGAFFYGCGFQPQGILNRETTVKMGIEGMNVLKMEEHYGGINRASKQVARATIRKALRCFDAMLVSAGD